MDAFQHSQRPKSLITGASKGIGKKLANYFASQDYDLILTSLPNENLLKLKEQLEATYSVSIECHEFDFKQSQAVQNFCRKIENYQIQILINNAGFFYAGLLADDFSSIRELMEVNFFAQYYITNSVIKNMMINQSGYIFNIASACGKRARAELGMYAISKYSVVGFNEALYEEMMKNGIKVTALCPSVVDTDFDFDSQLLPSDKIQLDDILNVIKFLLSLGKSAYIKEIIIDCKGAFIKRLNGKKK